MLAPPALAATSLMLSGPDPACRETLRLFVHLVTMDERQTLRVMRAVPDLHCSSVLTVA